MQHDPADEIWCVSDEVSDGDVSAWLLCSGSWLDSDTEDGNPDDDEDAGPQEDMEVSARGNAHSTSIILHY